MQYQLKRSWQARSLRLRMDQDGQILVRAPQLTPKILIDNFVAQNAAWIAKNRAKIQARAQARAEKPDEIKIFGQSYQLKFAYQPDLASGFVVAKKTLLYNSSLYALKPKANTQLTAAEKTKLERFLRQTLKQYLNQRLPQLHQQMQIARPFGAVHVKDQSSRWGSCSSDGNLNFNYHLVQQPPVVIDYVLIHELAHLVHLNHSDQFWALVAKYDGNYKQHRRALRAVE